MAPSSTNQDYGSLINKDSLILGADSSLMQKESQANSMIHLVSSSPSESGEGLLKEAKGLPLEWHTKKLNGVR